MSKQDRVGQPESVISGTIYRNAFIGDIEVHNNVPVTVDAQGRYWININGWRERVTKLGDEGDGYDAPDSICHIKSKQMHVDAAVWCASKGIVSDDEQPELWLYTEQELQVDACIAYLQAIGGGVYLENVKKVAERQHYILTDEQIQTRLKDRRAAWLSRFSWQGMPQNLLDEITYALRRWGVDTSGF